MFFFMMMYISSFFFLLSSVDWFLIWLGLEINMISFIMLIYDKYSMMNIESCIKYFFVQSIGSIMLLMFFYMNLNVMSYLGGIILCYKIGGGPFYFWFCSVCKNIGWWSFFFLSTFQKIMPMMLISLFLSKVLWLMSLLSLMIGVLGSINQTDIKLLMVYSSVHHIGWILISLLVKVELWLLYLLIYTVMLMSWMNYLMLGNFNSIKKIVSSKNKWIIMFILMNLAGIPPLMGFFLKWWSFYFFMSYDYSLLILLMMFSMIMLYVYFRLFYDLIMGGSFILSWSIKIEKIFNFQYDVMMIFSTLMGSYLGIMFL